MNDAERWIRSQRIFDSLSDPEVMVLTEYLALRNEPFENINQWSLPGPKERQQWKAQARMFVEE